MVNPEWMSYTEILKWSYDNTYFDASSCCGCQSEKYGCTDIPEVKLEKDNFSPYLFVNSFDTF